MSTGDSPVTFWDLQTLLNPGPLLTGTSEISSRVICNFVPDIAYGDLADTDAWLVSQAGTPFNVVDLTISAGRIIVTYTTFIGPADLVEFIGPPPIFRDVTNGILRSFISPVPFP